VSPFAFPLYLGSKDCGKILEFCREYRDRNPAKYLASLLDVGGQRAVERFNVGLMSKHEASIQVDASLRREKALRGQGKR
jgi:hypothetical protein